MNRSRLVAALCAVSFAILVASAPPAHAHAGLTGSNPSAGQSLEVAPERVELTFSEPVSSPAYVAVSAADRSSVVAGEPEISGSTVSQALATGLPAGEYTMAYRVISVDGHPITGEVPFTVTNDSPDMAVDNSSGSPTVTPTAEPGTAVSTADPVAEGDQAGESGNESFLDQHASHLALGAGLIAVAVALLVIGRRRRG